MPNLGVDGSLLWYDRRGSGSPVMFLSGLGGNHTLWNYQVQALSGRYECIVFDNRGTGESSLDAAWKTPERYTLKRLALDALSILDTLDIPKVHLVGTSMGGVVAQLLAIDHPERVRSLSLHSTWARSRELARVRLETWIRLLDLIDMPEFLAHLAPWIWSDRTLAVDAERIGSFRKKQRDLGSMVEKDVYVLQCRASIGVETIDGIASVKVPALVTSGEDDLLVPTDESHILHDAIERSRFHVFAGCGHAPFIEVPDQFNETQDAFLETVEITEEFHS